MLITYVVLINYMPYKWVFQISTKEFNMNFLNRLLNNNMAVGLT